MILAKCGKNVNIEKGALFSSKVELGDNSGIGINSSIGGKCIIGNDVMMGRDCIVYTRNHKFDDITTTMRGQGFQEERPVYIGNNVFYQPKPYNFLLCRKLCLYYINKQG